MGSPALALPRFRAKLAIEIWDHEHLRAPANQLGFAPNGIKIRDTHKSLLIRTIGAWRPVSPASDGASAAQ